MKKEQLTLKGQIIYADWGVNDPSKFSLTIKVKHWDPHVFWLPSNDILCWLFDKTDATISEINGQAVFFSADEDGELEWIGAKKKRLIHVGSFFESPVTLISGWKNQKGNSFMFSLEHQEKLMDFETKDATILSALGIKTITELNGHGSGKNCGGGCAVCACNDSAYVVFDKNDNIRGIRLAALSAKTDMPIKLTAKRA